ncbi:hypothetical protein HK405_008821 [Cladochytrium tenue]|nr:hypothetical protein HK405_008821 [Cladochytrium tenue]
MDEDMRGATPAVSVQAMVVPPHLAAREPAGFNGFEVAPLSGEPPRHSHACVEDQAVSRAASTTDASVGSVGLSPASSLNDASLQSGKSDSRALTESINVELPLISSSSIANATVK